MSYDSWWLEQENYLIMVTEQTRVNSSNHSYQILFGYQTNNMRIWSR